MEKVRFSWYVTFKVLKKSWDYEFMHLLIWFNWCDQLFQTEHGVRTVINGESLLESDMKEIKRVEEEWVTATEWLQAAEKWRLRVMNAAHNSNCDSNHSYVSSSLQPQGRQRHISRIRFFLRVSLRIACGRVATALTYTINPHEVWDYIKYSVVLYAHDHA